MLAPTPGRTFSGVTSHQHAEDAHLRATGLKGLPGKISGAPTGRRQRWDWLARVDISRDDSTYLMEVLLRSKSILWPNGSPLVYSTKYKGKLCLFEGTISTTRIRSWLLQIRPCSCWKSQVALSLVTSSLLQWSGTQSVWALPASLTLVLRPVSLTPLLSHPSHPCFLSIWSLVYFKPCTSSHPGSGMLYPDSHTTDSRHMIRSLAHIPLPWTGLLALLLAHAVANKRPL